MENNNDKSMMTEETDILSRFESIFFRQHASVPIRVPDYQRAYSWEQKQVDLFIADLRKFEGKSGYYFGHFIVEEDEGSWALVDGQQRLTTFVLFLMVCQHLSSQVDHPAYSLIARFETVSYDAKALANISGRLDVLQHDFECYDGKKLPTDSQIRKVLGTSASFTRSQGRMVRALLRFQQAFKQGELDKHKVDSYIAIMMNSHASLHLTRDKSVAVNIFEMHNTRGVPLSTLEIIKAKLMQFVHDHGGIDSKKKVEAIQTEFGEIYAMEESLTEESFRGEVTMDQLLRLHLRVVEDGEKHSEGAFRVPALNASPNALIEHVELGLRYIDGNKNLPKCAEIGVDYALNLARELKKSVRIVSQVLPDWDQDDRRVGDVMILDWQWSLQFFLITCRLLKTSDEEVDGRLSGGELSSWERFLFTRDFHDKYYNLKGSRDHFEQLYEKCIKNKDLIPAILEGYLKDGFRHWDHTKGLQDIVACFLRNHKKVILRNAYGWWRHKMLYVIYKYEVSAGSNIRKIVKDAPSLEHILPQNWEWEWIEEEDVPPKPKEKPVGGRESAQKQVNSYVNGLGNLILLTGSENASQGNRHPKNKRYLRHKGGSFDWHHANLDNWESSTKWFWLITRRGLKIYQFMMNSMITPPEQKSPALNELQPSHYE